MMIESINSDIKVFYVTAESFPEGISAAFDKLRSLLQKNEGRRFFGISNGTENGNIVYRAAVEESYPGEAETCGCETFIIKRDNYVSERLNNWQKNIRMIGDIFQKLLNEPGIDKNGYCLEIYLNETDVLCMVKLDTTSYKEKR